MRIPCTVRVQDTSERKDNKGKVNQALQDDGTETLSKNYISNSPLQTSTHNIIYQNKFLMVGQSNELIYWKILHKPELNVIESINTSHGIMQFP